MCKVLILTPFYPPNQGGAETFTEQLAKEASKWFKLTLLTFQPLRGKTTNYEEYSFTKGCLKIYRLNWWIKPPNVWKGDGIKNALLVIPRMAFGLFALCIKEKYKIVHAQGMLSALVAIFFKRIFRYKVYLTVLALYNFKDWRGIKRWIGKYIVNNCDLIFVEGDNGKKDINWLSQASDHIRKFTHWCDQSVFKPAPRPSGKLKVLFIGRPIREKGMHIIQEAEKLINDPYIEFTYVTKAEYSELPKIYQQHHILVIPSIYNEGHTRVVIEGASSGCSIITSDRGSLPEQVRDFGIATEAKPENFMMYIIGVDHEAGGQLAYDYAKKHYSPKNAEVFLNAYSSCN